MLRAVVKNTFLAIQADEEVAAGRIIASSGASMRARSADTPRKNGDCNTLDHLTNLISLAPGQWQPARLPAAVSAEEQAPTVDELRRLQRKLSQEMTRHKRVMSSSSVSTMVGSECDDRSGLHHVWSSGSVNTICSEFWEGDNEDGCNMEFGPIFEEEQPVLAKAEGSGSTWMGGASEYSQGECAQSDRAQDFSHGRVPKNVNLAEEFSRSGHEGPPTTMMIRNIPNRYTQRDLIRELESLGFGGTFDFLYVPIDKGTMCNVGYAFVNFVDHTRAAMCMRVFDNYSFTKHRKARGKIATVSVAHIQGLEANIRHYENAAVNGTARSRQRGPVIMASIAKSLAHATSPQAV